MGTAEANGPLWSARVRDWATLVEPLFRPAYDQVLGELDVKPGTKVLDAGCGSGLAAQIAAEMGAVVAGLDASESSLEIARERVPQGDFRSGDIEALPWPDRSFDRVTGFNAFQFASDIVGALREAGRVTRPAGRVAMMVWGLDEDCESAVTTGAVRQLMPPPPPGPPEPAPLGSEGRVEQLMTDAGLKPVKSGHVTCNFEFPDLDTAVRGFASAGGIVAAGRQLGEEKVGQVLRESLRQFQRNGRIVQKNDYRYVIAEA
jgi:SAM-dependent methyltransferase